MREQDKIDEDNIMVSIERLEEIYDEIHDKACEVQAICDDLNHPDYKDEHIQAGEELLKNMLKYILNGHNKTSWSLSAIINRVKSDFNY